jgi:uncharacterized protein YkwD
VYFDRHGDGQPMRESPDWGRRVVRSQCKPGSMLILKKVFVLFVAGFAVLGGAGAAQAASLNHTEANLLRAVNATRASFGLRPVRLDATLERAARAHTGEMLRSGAFSHGDFRSRIIAFGARGPVLGENLAWGVGSYASATTIVREWLASPEHRANLLRPGYRRIGIGAARGRFQGSFGATVVTTDFGGF